MATSLQQTDTAATDGNIAACSGLANATTPDNRQASVGGIAGSVGHVVTIPQTNANREGIAFESAPGALDSFSVIPAGNWIVRVHVSVAATRTSLNGCWICRVNSSGVSQSTIASSTTLGLNVNSTGVVSFTLAGGSDTPVTGDRLYWVLGFKNPGPGGDSFTYLSDQLLDTPLGSAFDPSFGFPYVCFPAGERDIARAIGYCKRITFSFGRGLWLPRRRRLIW